MRKPPRYLFLVILLSTFNFQLSTLNCEAFFVGFGATGGADNVVKQGQDQGVIPLIPGAGLGGFSEFTNAETVLQIRYGTVGIEQAKGIAVDNAGNFCVTGYCLNAFEDYLTVMFDAGGNTVFRNVTVDTLGANSRGNDVALDDTGNAYVTGFSDGANKDFLTIKYKTNGGTPCWQHRYNVGIEEAYGIAVDPHSNIYIAGVCDGYFTTIKYISGANTPAWANRYFNDPISSAAEDVAVDLSGNAYVTGRAHNGIDFDYFTIKYDTDGNTVWHKTYDSGGNDRAYGIAVDPSRNVYVTGNSNNDFFTIKYDPNGNLVWQARCDSGAIEQANGIAVDSRGNAYVAGFSFDGANNDYLTIKYGSGGSVLWQRTYNSGLDDLGEAIAVDASGNVYVAGTSKDDFFILKYRQY